MTTTQYIGARYVPIFADPIEWNNTRTYDPLTIVIHQGNSYTSRQFVPVGVDINNETFWVLTGNYNAQVEAYRQEVMMFDSRIAANKEDVSTLKGIITASTNYSKNLFNAYIKWVYANMNTSVDVNYIPQSHCFLGNDIYIGETDLNAPDFSMITAFDKTTGSTTVNETRVKLNHVNDMTSNPNDQYPIYACGSGVFSFRKYNANLSTYITVNVNVDKIPPSTEPYPNTIQGIGYDRVQNKTYFRIGAYLYELKDDNSASFIMVLPETVSQGMAVNNNIGYFLSLNRQLFIVDIPHQTINYFPLNNIDFSNTRYMYEYEGLDFDDNNDLYASVSSGGNRPCSYITQLSRNMPFVSSDVKYSRTVKEYTYTNSRIFDGRKFYSLSEPYNLIPDGKSLVIGTSVDDIRPLMFQNRKLRLINGASVYCNRIECNGNVSLSLSVDCEIILNRTGTVVNMIDLSNDSFFTFINDGTIKQQDNTNPVTIYYAKGVIFYLRNSQATTTIQIKAADGTIISSPTENSFYSGGILVGTLKP